MAGGIPWPTSSSVTDCSIFDDIRNTMICVAIAFTDANPDAAAAYDDAMTRLDAMERRMAAGVVDAQPAGAGDSPTMVPLLAEQTFRSGWPG